MRNIKVILQVVTATHDDYEVAHVRAERVARFGTAQGEIEAYEPFLDETVNVLMVVLDWPTSQRFPLYRVPIEKLRFDLNDINLQIP